MSMGTRKIISTYSPQVVSQKLTDVLLTFPAAAWRGIQWSVLKREYEKRQNARLDLAALGHDTALAATHTLLWEVLRVVNGEDVDNPVVALEESVALHPKPCSAATWPSLYTTLVKILQEHGSREGDGSSEILVSQLKGLLQLYWHSSFDEGMGTGYLTEQGQQIKLKKMKHLLSALLIWRKECLAWQQEAGGQRFFSTYEAIKTELELVPSKRHNDLILRLVQPGMEAPLARVTAKGERWSDAMDDEDISRSSQSTMAENAAADEMATLKEENAKLQRRNLDLELCLKGNILHKQVMLPEDVLDNPFEPPPQLSYLVPTSPVSTYAQSCFTLSTEVTPLASSYEASGSVTPVPVPLGPAVGAPMTMVPVVWFPASQVPNGIVQQARDFFEQHRMLPSFFQR